MPPSKVSKPAEKHRFAASVSARRRHKKAREGSPSEEPSTSAPAERKKPGRKSDFVGAREAFIDAHYNDFLKVHRGPRTSQARFWEKFFEEYWATFHWSIPLDVDPKPDFVPPSEPEEPSEEYIQEKSETIERTKKVSKISAFYYLWKAEDAS